MGIFMTMLNIGYNPVTKIVNVYKEGDQLPTGSVSIGIIDHDIEPDTGDTLGYHGNHVLFHHVRDALYRYGMQFISHVTIYKNYEDSGTGQPPVGYQFITRPGTETILTNSNGQLLVRAI